MKIGIDARSLCFKQRGIPVYVFQILKLLPQILKDSQIYAFINTEFEHNEPASQYTQRLDDIRLQGVNIVDVKCETDIKWEQYLLPRSLKEHGIDVLHMPANRVCLFAHCPQVTTIHDTLGWTGLHFPKYSLLLTKPKLFLYNFRRTLMFYLQYKFGLRKAQHVLTISDFSLRDIQSHFPFTQNKISFVYHGLPDLFNSNHPIKAIEQRQFILMLGGESKHKNPYNMLRAFANLPSEVKKQFPLKIIGIHPDAISIFSAWVKDLEIEKFVMLHSWVDESTLLESFSNARAFLFASIEEGFGFPAIQAMSCATPIVTSKAEVLIELTQDSLLSARYNDIDTLSKHLFTLCQDDQEWLTQSSRCYSLSKAFSWPDTISHIGQLYVDAFNANQTTTSKLVN